MAIELTICQNPHVPPFHDPHPHHCNFNKRLIKTPKLCFLDAKLAAW